MERTVIKINEALCNGCGQCVRGCHEGALQLVNGKAVMVSDLYCDGLGACIGECPTGAITLEKREASPYDEIAVMERLAPKGEAVILAHLRHLKEHGEERWLQQGIEYIREHGLSVDLSQLTEPAACCTHTMSAPAAGGCPGSAARTIPHPGNGFTLAGAPQPTSELSHFPVQFHLLNPHAPFLKGSDLLLAADCTAFACGNFHAQFLRGHTLAIACPKLDSNLPRYVEKLTAMIDEAELHTLTVVIMEVPCCRGLLQVAVRAREAAQRHIPIEKIVVSVSGKIIERNWI